MDDDKKNTVDLISNLHSDLIQTILNHLPLKDAANSSFLSNEWRYKWTSISKLTLFFDKQSYVDPQPYSTIPLFNFKELTYLELHKCQVENPSPSFEGFLQLKFLKFHSVVMEPNYNNFISSCPLLETLVILRPILKFDKINLNLSAPKLKYLTLNGNFMNVYIENALSLISVDVSFHRHFDKVFFPSDNFDRFIGKIPCLERLEVDGFFAKYLSIDIEKSNSRLIQQQYNHLKFIKLHELSLTRENEIQLLLRLILNSPNLEKLEISERFHNRVKTAVKKSSFQRQAFVKWRNSMEKEYYCPDKEYNLFRGLKRVEIKNVYGLRNETELVKFILERAPKLELLIIQPCSGAIVNIEWFALLALIGYPKASPQAQLIFRVKK